MPNRLLFWYNVFNEQNSSRPLSSLEPKMKKSTVRLLARSSRPVCIARTSTNAGHILAVCAAAHGEVLTFKATRDGQAVRALSVAFEGRKPVSDSTVAAIASRLVNDLEGYDRDAMETFADALIGGWDFDYSAHVGAALDRLAAAKLLTR